MFKKIHKKIETKKIYFILFILILALMSSINIFHKGLIYGDDINFHIHRILAVTDNIKIGKYVPVYFNYLNGFGYANGLFYPDFFLIIPAILNHLGIDIIISLKIFIVIINISAIYTMYLCVYGISKEKKCAHIGMILYSLSNYRLIDFAQRGALGEMLAFVFIPLIILGLYKILYENENKGYYLAIGLCGLCFSHVISFYLMVFFTIVIILINIKNLKQKERLKSLIIYIMLAVLITSHFWMPMIEQIIKYKFSILVNSKIFENIIPIYLLFFDLPINSFHEYYPAGIGLIYYMQLINIFKSENKFISTLIKLGVFCTIVTSISLIWKINIFYKIFNVIQFPWRMYMFSTIFFIISLSMILKNKKHIKICLIYTIIIFIANATLISLNVYIKKPLDNEIMLGEYLPEKFKLNYINEYKNNNIKVTRNNNILNIEILNQTDNIEVPLIYYEGYIACNEKCYEVYETEKGLVGIKTNKEINNINIWYKGTNIYNITKYISVIGIIPLIYKIKKNNK